MRRWVSVASGLLACSHLLRHRWAVSTIHAAACLCVHPSHTVHAPGVARTELRPPRAARGRSAGAVQAHLLRKPIFTSLLDRLHGSRCDRSPNRHETDSGNDGCSDCASGGRWDGSNLTCAIPDPEAAASPRRFASFYFARLYLPGDRSHSPRSALLFLPCTHALQCLPPPNNTSHKSRLAPAA